MKRTPFLLVTGLALVSAGGAHAAPPGRPAIVDSARLIAAFEQICLDHINDPQARAGIARAAPWNMRADPGDPALFEAMSIQAHIVEADQRCAVTARIDDASSLESVAIAASALLPRAAAESGVSNDTLMWAANDQTGAKFGVGLKVSNQSGMNLATFNVQKLGHEE